MPAVGININIDKYNWIGMILSGEKTIETRPLRCAGQWRRYIGSRIGIVRTSSDTSRLPTGLLVGIARLADVKEYRTREQFDADLKGHWYKSRKDYAEHPRCGLVLSEVEPVAPLKLAPAGMGTVRRIIVAKP